MTGRKSTLVQLREQPGTLDNYARAAFGALPFLFATGAGAEQRKPIGVVVFYGTLVSVFLTLFVVPAVYSLIARKTKSPHYMSDLVDKLMSSSGKKAGDESPSAPDSGAHPPAVVK